MPVLFLVYKIIVLPNVALIGVASRSASACGSGCSEDAFVATDCYVMLSVLLFMLAMALVDFKGCYFL
jgi:hypothetical protein